MTCLDELTTLTIFQSILRKENGINPQLLTVVVSSLGQVRKDNMKRDKECVYCTHLFDCKVQQKAERCLQYQERKVKDGRTV